MLYLAGAILVCLAYLIVAGRSNKEIHQKFGVPERSHTLISTDLGKVRSKIFLRRDGVTGVPDAVFESAGKKEVVAGEFKSRSFKGYVRYYELYQLMLYMGHLQARYPSHAIRGHLAYADNNVVIIFFDQALYDGLMSMKRELQAASRTRNIPSAVPLHKRMTVNKMNPALRLRMY